MKKSIIITILAILLLCGSSYATSFKVTQVIEVDSAVGGPMLGPIKWSPDGLKLSYFKGKQLYISDTLGNTTFVKELELFPHRYEWLDNDKLVLHIKKNDGPTSTNKLITVDINTHQDSLISSYIYQAGKSSKIAGFESFRGPLLTQEGNVYYEIENSTGNNSTHNNISQVIVTGSLNKSVSNNTILHGIRSEIIYEFDIDTKDSTYLADKPGWKGASVVKSQNGELLLTTHYIINLTDSSINDFDPYFQTNILDTVIGCSYLYYSFNPIYPEIIFEQSCDDGHTVLIERIGIFNFQTNEAVLLEDLTGHQTGSTPIYHPQGKMIAYCSKGKLFIIYRTGVGQ